MRHIILTDDGYTVAANASHRMLAACFFPESPRDQAQALFIAALEQEEFRNAGADHYRPSEIMLAASNLVEKRTAQLYSVGFMVFAYLWLAKSPYRPSLRRASILASCSAGEFGGITWRAGLDPKGKDKVQPMTDDPASLQRTFRKYRSVAHICAARVAAGGYFEHGHLWDDTPLATEALIQTAVTIQARLQEITDTSTWNIWDLTRHYPASLSGSPVLLPDDELLTWVGLGYQRALDEGKIVLPDG
jgi:hypothetical protein